MNDSNEKAPRKKREVYGPNFKWNTNSNMLAYCCYRAKEPKSSREMIAKKLGIEPSTLNTRIQHFNSLSEHSNSKKATPSSEVKSIFLNSQYLSIDECNKYIQKFLHEDEVSEYFHEEPQVDGLHAKEAKDSAGIDFEIVKTNKVDDLNSIFKNYWVMQRDFQKYDMNSMPLNDFFKVVSTMNIKSRGMKIEKRILINNAKFLKKSVMSEQGDAWLGNGDGLEIKTSFITPLVGSSVSLTGLRLWEEKVKFYFLLVVDIRNIEVEPIIYSMWVPKEKLEEMDNNSKLGTPGMKKSDAKGNANVAKSLTLKTETLEEWAKLYPAPEWFVL